MDKKQKGSFLYQRIVICKKSNKYFFVIDDAICHFYHRKKGRKEISDALFNNLLLQVFAMKTYNDKLLVIMQNQYGCFAKPKL